MAKIFSIGILLASIVTLTGCSSADNPLEGKWHGTVLISGPVLSPLVPVGHAANGDQTPLDQSAVARMSVEFLPGDQLRYEIEPLGDRNTEAPKVETASYQILESRLDEFRIRLDLKEQQPDWEIRLAGPDALTITQVNADPRLLPVKMTRVTD
ncbi:hypothetical protein GC197_06570 [bacterium]|nr:hypothetical protein [bacterium]